MTYSPRTTTEVYEELRGYLRGQTDALTDFTEDSLNRVIFRQGFSRYWTRFEYARLAVQLSGWIDYAGGPITEEDLISLGFGDRLGEIDLQRLNSFIDDNELDELAANVGVVRDPGDFAEGELLFETQTDRTQIPAGTQVATERGPEGDSLVFETDATVRPEPNTTTVTAPITALERGTEYNVGSNQIERLPQNVGGVNSVTNPEATAEGQNEESNDELRIRAKNALIAEAGGGTTAGVRGEIINGNPGLEQGDVVLDEHYDGTPTIPETEGAPYVDVIVDGANRAELEASLEDGRSVGMYHRIVRPEVVVLNVSVELETSGVVETDNVENVVTNRISDRGLGESVHRDKLIQSVMNIDNSIGNIATLEVESRNEPHLYSTGTDVYDSYGLMQDFDEGGFIEVTGQSAGSSTTFTKGTDYAVRETNGHYDRIDWSIGGTTPDDDTLFYMNYVVEEDVLLDTPRRKLVPGTITASVLQ